MPTTSTGRTRAVRDLRTRVSERMLRTGTELAIDQRELEDRLATVSGAELGYSGAQGAVALARWADSLVLWLAWRGHPPALPPPPRPPPPPPPPGRPAPSPRPPPPETPPPPPPPPTP